MTVERVNRLVRNDKSELKKEAESARWREKPSEDVRMSSRATSSVSTSHSWSCSWWNC